MRNLKINNKDSKVKPIPGNDLSIELENHQSDVSPKKYHDLKNTTNEEWTSVTVKIKNIKKSMSILKRK